MMTVRCWPGELREGAVGLAPALGQMANRADLVDVLAVHAIGREVRLVALAAFGIHSFLDLFSSKIFLV